MPALTTRRAETTIELGSGQGFAIAGLLQKSADSDLRKFPVLGDIPVLGALFPWVNRRFAKGAGLPAGIALALWFTPVSPGALGRAAGERIAECSGRSCADTAAPGSRP